MRVLIKSDANGIPETESDFIAWQGFENLGFRTSFFKTYEELSECRPDDLIVGGVTIIRDKMKEYGIEIEEYDYPDALSEMFGRRIWHDTLQSVFEKKDEWPVFVKPVRDKAFVGFVLRDETNIPRLRQTSWDAPVLCSDPINFVAEWRAFIRYDSIWDVRPYKGDWHSSYDVNILDWAVENFYDAPAGYAMDIGVTDKGETLLVEINDGFALGCYGADAIQYAKLLSARWCELVGIHDECDTFHEADDWKKRHR